MPFDIMYPDKAKEMKRMVLEYIKILRRDHFSVADVDTSNGLQRDTLQIDATGFPIAPRPLTWTKVTKAELEPIFRLYMKRHYRMSYFFWDFSCTT
jgi:hypothetical protein